MVGKIAWISCQLRKNTTTSCHLPLRIWARVGTPSGRRPKGCWPCPGDKPISLLTLGASPKVHVLSNGCEGTWCLPRVSDDVSWCLVSWCFCQLRWTNRLTSLKSEVWILQKSGSPRTHIGFNDKELISYLFQSNAMTLHTCLIDASIYVAICKVMHDKGKVMGQQQVGFQHSWETCTPKQPDLWWKTGRFNSQSWAGTSGWSDHSSTEMP